MPPTPAHPHRLGPRLQVCTAGRRGACAVNRLSLLQRLSVVFVLLLVASCMSASGPRAAIALRLAIRRLGALPSGGARDSPAPAQRSSPAGLHLPDHVLPTASLLRNQGTELLGR